MAEVKAAVAQVPVAAPAHTRVAERSTVVDLDWPVEFDGKVWDKITVSRMTAAQLKDFYESLESNPKDTRLPIFDAPPQVLDSLDADDDLKLEEVAQRFLPRRFRAQRTEDAPTPDHGEPLSQSPAAT